MAGADDPHGDWDRHEVLPFVPGQCEAILDVGCGRGAFGELLKLQRPEARVSGIESVPDRAKQATERLDLVTCGSFPYDLPAGEAFDCIVFNDVLEHLADPWQAINHARSVLSGGHGYVVASIPNVQHYSVSIKLLLRGEWHYVDAGILDRTHLRFFTKKSMRELFETQGFVVDIVAPINKSTGTWIDTLLALIPNLTESICANQYVVVART